MTATVPTFALAAFRYWFGVFPRACRQLRCLRRRASEIEDPVLRQAALQALAKRGNLEGAVAFAAFLPRRRRHAAIDALMLYQAIYNYTDTLAEQSSPDPARNARQLHGALLDALANVDEAARACDYHAHHARGDDGGYLAELVGSCRSALAGLPGFGVLAVVASRAAGRIVCFQSLSWAGPASPLEEWARRETPAESGLEWWETAGAAGSSLLVHVVIATAAAGREHGAPATIEEAYFPWICALHSLLDSLVDEQEDAREGQLSLVGCYASGEEACDRLRWLAGAAAGAARSLPEGRRHSVLLAGMVGYYVSEMEREGVTPADLAAELRHELGWPLGVALLLFRTRRLGARCLRRGGQSRAGALGARAVPRECMAAVELEDA